MKKALRLWKFNTRTGYWEYQRSVTDETARVWLDYYKKDEPTQIFVLSANTPLAFGKPVPARAKRGSG